MVVTELLVNLILDSAQYTQGMDNAEKKAEGFGGAMAGLSTIGGGVLTAAFSAAAAGATLLGVGLLQSTQEAAKAEQVQAQLNAVIKSTGGIAGVTAKEVNELSDSLSTMTMFDDEAITSAQSLLLTFTDISEDVFPDATKTVLDMSQALGQDLKASAVQLGKALQDPIQGVTALRRVGVNFTEEQQEMIKAMVEAGDKAGAQKFIMAELGKEFGGSAEAAGKTFAGQLAILQNRFDNIKESVGNALLPVLTQLATTFNEYIARPETQAFITALAANIQTFAMQAATQLPIAIQWIQQAFGWFANNQGVIIGALAAIGVAVAAFVYTTVIPAAVATISALAPVILIMLAVGAVAFLVYQAWVNNFGGIQDKLRAVWKFIEPILASLFEWLSTNIPIALQALTDAWNLVLLPALMMVWDWLSANLFPLLQAIGNFMFTVWKLQITVLAGVWLNVLWPALQRVGGFLATNLFPILMAVGKFMATYFLPAIHGIGIAFNWLANLINTVSGALNRLELPPWLTPGSPTPLEIGILGVVDAMDELSRVNMPALQTDMPGFGQMSAGAGQNKQIIELTINAMDKTLKQTLELLMDEKIGTAINGLVDGMEPA